LQYNYNNGTPINRPVPDQVKLESARMSKITNDGQSRSSTGLEAEWTLRKQRVKVIWQKAA